MNFNFNKYSGKFDESKFVIGLDIGDNMSSISFFNCNNNMPEQIDLSGGYGKSSIPTVVQYISDSEEWIFGEYALLNKSISDSITFQNIISNLGKNAIYNIDGENKTQSFILSCFIKEIVGSVKNINPNSEVIGIIISVSCKMSEKAEKEFYDAILMSGYSNVFIGFISSEEALMYRFFSNSNIEFDNGKNFLFLDFGSREIRALVYTIHKYNRGINAEYDFSLFNSNIGVKSIEEHLFNIFFKYFRDETKLDEKSISITDKINIELFTYQHKDIIFKNKNKNGVKLYFNFCYPPFKKSISCQDIDNIINEFKEKLISFFNSISEYNFKIDNIVCGGGGFDMPWVIECVKDYFSTSSITIYKNPKGIISEGACLVAAKALGLFDGIAVSASYNTSLDYDIGIMTSENYYDRKFIPIIERNSFSRQTFEKRKIFIKGSSSECPSIEIFKRTPDGNISIIANIKLHNAPNRKGYTNCFNVSFAYCDENSVNVKIEDLGFGCFFPKSDYVQNFNIKL